MLMHGGLVHFNLCINLNVESYVGEDGEEDHYGDMVRRDKRRWELADKDGDNELNKEEFANFLHPEEAEHMKDVIVLVRFSCVCYLDTVPISLC